MNVVVIGAGPRIRSRLTKRFRDGHDPLAASRGSRRSAVDVAMADTAIHPIERSLPPADPLALDPLSPTAIGPSGDTSSLAGPLALDPLGPIAPPPDERWFRPAY